MMHMVRLAALALSLLAVTACKDTAPSVTIYTSVDRSFSEPILLAFEARTGIRVDALYDVEAAKTTGLVNKLLAEAGRPRADVFWNGELVQTQRLAAQGLLAPYVPKGADEQGPDALWTAFGGRARVMIINTDRMARARPTGLADFLSRQWQAGDLAVAHPLFGTSATQAAALYALWGPDVAGRYYRDLQAAGVQIVDGNSVVRDMAVRGDILFGLTDTDDACAAYAKGAPVAVIFPDQGPNGIGTLVIPNTVALVAGAPHADTGKALIDYLLQAQVAQDLADAGWFHVDGDRVLAAQSCGLPDRVKRMQIDPETLSGALEGALSDLRQVLVR